VTFKVILTEIRASGAQDVRRGNVTTVEIEQHRLVNEFMSNGHQTEPMYVSLHGGEDDILRLVYFHPSREIWTGQVWNMIVFHFTFRLVGRRLRTLSTCRRLCYDCDTLLGV
jgi:hypothetical protein